MNNEYDYEFLQTTVEEIEDLLAELSRWSVYNHDVGLDQIHEYRELFAHLSGLLLKIAESRQQKGDEDSL